MGKLLGVSANYVGMLEGGREPGNTLTMLFERLSKDELDLEMPSLRLKEEPEEKQSIRRVPMISWAHAGEAATYEELPLSWQSFVATTSKDEKAFAVKIDGDSMEPKFSHGDIAVVEPGSLLRIGKPVIAKLANDGVVFRLYSLDREGHIILTAYSPAHPPLVLTKKDAQWIYYVPQVIKNT